MANPNQQRLTAIEKQIDIGLDLENRQGLAEMLCQVLADEHVLYIKTRNYHWNVTGMAFKPLHELFEEQYNSLALSIDEIAERVRTLGFFTPGSMGEFNDLARLVETGHLNGNAQEMLRNLVRDHETMIQILRHDQEAAMEKYNDASTNDFLIGLLQDHEKMAWMLRAHLV